MLDLVIRSNFEIVECNFAELATKLNGIIQEKFDIVVTEDGVKDAKKIRAELNKGKSALEKAWRAKKQELELPIKELNEQAKSVFALCDEAMEKIDSQVRQFEAKKKELAVTLCEEYKNQVCELKGIDPSSINVSGFSNLGYVTEKGALSSSGKQAVDNLILAKVAEIAEQKQREAEAQMEIERIKQQAREELLQQQQTQAPVQEEAQQAPTNNTSKEKGVYVVNATFAVSVNGEWNQATADKVKEFFEKEFKANPKLSQALRSLKVGF